MKLLKLMKLMKINFTLLRLLKHNTKDFKKSAVNYHLNNNISPDIIYSHSENRASNR